MDTFDKRVKNNIEVILGDVNDFNLIKKETKKIDIIFHLAALISIPYSYKSPKSYLDTNIIGTYNILEAARENNVELIVNTSTSRSLRLNNMCQLMKKTSFKRTISICRNQDSCRSFICLILKVLIYQ